MNEKKKNKPILVPVDFSAPSETALINAAELAEKLNSDIGMGHVGHDRNDAPGYYSVKGRNKQMRRMEDVAAEMLEEFSLKMKRKYTNLSALEQATTMLVVDFYVIGGAHVPDEVVYNLVKTMHANKAYLQAANSRFNLFEPKAMKATSPVEYHPGALKAYKELGVM